MRTEAKLSASHRWFISASHGVEVGPIVAGLRARGEDPYLLSDVAPLGANLTQSLRKAIAEADRVLVVLADTKTSDGEPTIADPNTIFEAGFALGLGKEVLILADPRIDIPVDLSDFLIVRGGIDDFTAIDFALDQAKGRVSSPEADPSPSGHALGSAVDALLARLDDESTLTEEVLVDVLAEAIELSGAQAVRSHGKEGFDLGVWSDDLGAIAANPLVIEVKRSLTPRAIEQTWAGLTRVRHGQIALLVYLKGSPPDRTPSKQVGLPILTVALPELLRRMRSASFAEVVRDLRNRSAHGLPL